MDYNWKNCKTQTLRRSLQGNSKASGETKQENERNLKPLALATTANIKHSPISSQLKIKHHSNVLFTSIPITWYIISGFQLKITKHAKRHENTQSEKRKLASEIDSDMAEILKLSDREIKTANINMLRNLMEKYTIWNNRLIIQGEMETLRIKSRC